MSLARHVRRVIAIVILGSLVPIVGMRAQAAVSVIAGRVTDAETHRPLAGSIVTVEGTKFRATTKWDGTYRIPNVPAGVYTVRVRRLGFAAKSSDVTLGAEGQVCLLYTSDAA